MNRNLQNFAQRYQVALHKHLKQGRSASLEAARGLGSTALAAGLQTLDLAKLHEQILVSELLPGYTARKRISFIRQAGRFFAVAILPIEKLHRSAQEATAHLKTLSRA
jgi:hypothetical protein